MSRRRYERKQSDPPELWQFVKQQRLRGAAPLTLYHRVLFLRRFAAWLGSPLLEATPADLRRYLAGRRESIGAFAHNNEVGHLRAFYAGLEELGLVGQSPASELVHVRARSARRPLSLERVQKLLSAASQVRGPQTPFAQARALRDRAVLEVLFATGARASEVCRLQVVDVDLLDATTLIRRAKYGESRCLPLPRAAVAALQRYLDQARAVLLGARDRSQGRLFVGARGRPLTPSSLHTLVAGVGRRAGVRAHPHAFRHTLATELVRAGVNLVSVQEVLGHVSLATTSAYVAVDLRELRAALAELSKERAENHTRAPIFDNLQTRLFAEWRVSAWSEAA